MSEDPPVDPKKRRFPSTGFLVTVAIILLLLLFVVFQSIWPGGMNRTAMKRAEAKVAVTNLSAALQSYDTEYGSLPTGTNAEIMNALRGANPHKIAFFESRADRFDKIGAFLDPWGTPYHIDLSDPKVPKVHSSGKDKIDNGGESGFDDIASWTTIH
jgi:type II secretory pathway pseudopilin PulG